MYRRGFLVVLGAVATEGCVGGDRTPTPSPTPPDYVDRFETTLALEDIAVRELVVEDWTATLVYAVAEPTESRVRETIHVVASAYAHTVGAGWPVDSLQVTVRFGSDPVVHYRIETAWAETFNTGGTGSEYGEKIEGTVERVNGSG